LNSNLDGEEQTMSFAEIQKQIRDRDRAAESQSIEDVIQNAINQRTGLPRHVRDLAESLGVDPSDAGAEITSVADHAWALAEEHGMDPVEFQNWAMNRLHREAIEPHLDDRSIQSAARAMFGVSDRVARGVRADTDDTSDGKSRSTASIIREQVNAVKEHARAALGQSSDSGSDSGESAGDVGASETGGIVIR
jgi:hypothetical protein